MFTNYDTWKTGGASPGISLESQREEAEAVRREQEQDERAAQAVEDLRWCWARLSGIGLRHERLAAFTLALERSIDDNTAWGYEFRRRAVNADAVLSLPGVLRELAKLIEDEQQAA